MNTKKRLVELFGLVFLIELRRDSQGNKSYIFSFSDKQVRFRSMFSVFDFIEMNKFNFGDCLI